MPDLSGSSFLVTGAAGFVGAHLVAHLVASGASVCALTHKGHRITRLSALGVAHCAVASDLTDNDEIAAILDRVAPDVIFHLAAERDVTALIAKPDMSAMTGAALVRAAARLNLKRFVTIGSSLEYPDKGTGDPVGPHGTAKALAMQAMQRASIEVDLPFSAFRTHYVYGPLHGAQKLIPTAIRAAAKGATMPMTGTDIRKRFVYVGDIVAACMHVLTLPADSKEIYLATATDEHSNQDVIDRIAQLMGKTIDFETGAFASRGWDRPHWDLPVGATLLPGWQPAIHIDQGLKATILAEGFDVND
ncbi:MAG: NAD-dependent epimerase/dehydratase family protein [Sulfitobacter sp.]